MEIRYLDLIPEELNNLILHNLEEKDLIDNALDSTGINILDKILLSSSFWNFHVKLLYPDTPFEYVPNYLYNYTGQDIVVIIDNYTEFTINYMEAKGRRNAILRQLSGISTKRKVWKIKIYNSQVIINIIRKYFTSNRELYDFLYNEVCNIYIETDDKKIKLTFSDKNFDISDKQAFGLLLHIESNRN